MVAVTDPDADLEGGSSHEHSIRGVGDETRVDCGRDKTIYGPHPDALKNFQYCPYCGADAQDDEHRLHAGGGEVFCENTVMSTYRYCPGCGEAVT